MSRYVVLFYRESLVVYIVAVLSFSILIEVCCVKCVQSFVCLCNYDCVLLTGGSMFCCLRETLARLGRDNEPFECSLARWGKWAGLSWRLDTAFQNIFLVNDGLYSAGTVLNAVGDVQTVRGVTGNDEVVYQTIRAFKTRDGTRVWSYSAPLLKQMLLRFDTTHAYILAEDMLAAINLRDGKQNWQRKVSAQALLLDGETLYVGTGANEEDGCGSVTNSTLGAFETNNGTQRWQFTSASGSGPTLT